MLLYIIADDPFFSIKICFLIWTFIMLISFQFIKRSTVKPNKSGVYHLRLSNIYIINGTVGFLYVYMLFQEYFINEPNSMLNWWMIGGILLMVLAMIHTLLAHFNAQLIFNEESIRLINAYGREKEIKWDEIQYVTSPNFFGLLVIQGKEKKITLNGGLYVGFNTFMEFLEKKRHEY